MEDGRIAERVLVIGDDMRIFLAVVRSLGRAGKEVHAAPFDFASPALKSRYVSRVHRLPRYADGPAEWRAAMLDLLRAYSFELVVPTSDRAILPLHAHREDYASFRVAVPNADAVPHLFDKEQTRHLCGELGIPVAPGAILEREDSARQLAGRFGLPLVIKTRCSYSMDSLDDWGKVHIVDTEPELHDILGGLDDPDRYLVEGYFEGVGVGVSVLAEDGAVLQAFQHRRLRQGRGGSSSYRISEPVDPRLRDACEKICRRTNLTGVCMFEFRFNRSDRSWILLETNARFWGSSPLPISLGVDFPRFLYDLLVHHERHPLATYRAGIRSRNLILDGFNLLTDRPGFQAGPIGRWLADLGGFLTQPIRWLSGQERSDTFVTDDLVPAIWECATVLPALGRRPGRTRMARAKQPSEGARPRLETAR